MNRHRFSVPLGEASRTPGAHMVDKAVRRAEGLWDVVDFRPWVTEHTPQPLFCRALVS